MQLSTLKAKMKSGEIENFYIFTGPEIAVQKIYLQELSKVTNKPIKRYDSVSNYAKNSYSSALVKSSNIALIFNDKYFLSNEQLQSNITQNKTFSDDIIVLIYDAIDKRSKVYKEYEEQVIEFEYLRPDVLSKYIANDIDLDQKHRDILVEICERDYSRILLEIDKIKVYSASTGINNYNKIMDCLIKDGTIYNPPYDAVFDFVDAVLKKKPTLAFNLLEQSYEVGEATLVLLSNLYNSTKQLLQVQAYSGNNVSDATGLTPFQIKLARSRVGNYRNGELVSFMKLLRNMEKGIKTGDIEEQYAVNYALVNLWNVAS